jgi:predicted dehydrogenase
MAKESLGSVYTVRIDSRDPEPPSPEYMAQVKERQTYSTSFLLFACQSSMNVHGMVQMGSHFYDMTIHDFDEARWLLGQEPVSVRACC